MKASNLFSKFILLLYLAKFTTTDTVAIFGLYWSGLVMASMLMGFDLYSQTTRNILDSKFSRTVELNNHLKFSRRVAFLISPVAFLLFCYFVDAPSWVKLCFLLHLIFEYKNQEYSRLLIPLDRAFESSLLNFIRGSAWVFFAILASYIIYDEFLEIVIVFWITGSIFANVYGCFNIKKFIKTSDDNFSIRWVYNSLSACLLFFLSTILLRSILSLDRFIIENLYNKDVLAVYIFNAAIVFAVVGLVDVGVSVWKYPGMIREIKKNDKEGYFISLKSFFVENTVVSLIIILLVALLIPALTDLFLDPIYGTGKNAFYLMLMSVGLYSISMPLHYSIYGFGKDLYILVINLTGFISMLIFAKLEVFSDNVTNSSLLLTGGLVSIFIMRIIFCIKSTLNHSWKQD